MSPPSPLIDGYGSPSFPVRSQSNDTSSNDEGKGKGKAKEEGPLGEDGVYDGGKGSGMKIQGQIGIGECEDGMFAVSSRMFSSERGIGRNGRCDR